MDWILLMACVRPTCLAHKSMLGGVLRPNSFSMIGPYAERTLREMSADRAFLGVDGLDPSYGLCTTDMLGAQIDARRRITPEFIFHDRSLCRAYSAGNECRPGISWCRWTGSFLWPVYDRHAWRTNRC